MTVLLHLGAPAIDLLLPEVFNRRRSTAKKLALLEAIERLGHPLNMTHNMVLALRRHEFEPEVAEAIGRVLKHLGSRRRSAVPLPPLPSLHHSTWSFPIPAS